LRFSESTLTIPLRNSPDVREYNVPQDNSAMNIAHCMRRYRSAVEHAFASHTKPDGLQARAVDGGAHACL